MSRIGVMILINGEPVNFAGGAAQDTDNPSLELRGQDTVELRFGEEDQDRPAGMFRFQLTADEFKLQRATAADWSTWTDLFVADADAITLKLPDDERTLALEALFREVVSIREVLELTFA